MIYSYDIFDTILYRKVPKSVDIFAIMESKSEVLSLWKHKRESFFDSRRNCEFLLRRTKKEEIAIDEIYKGISQRNHLSTSICQRLKEIEFETEKEQSFLNTNVVNDIKKHINNQDLVVLITDMYWDEIHIRELLAEKEPIFDSINIYVSCEYGVTKANGKLFEIVKEKENANYENWVHIGDNAKSDGESPKKFGIKTFVVNGVKKYAYESKIGHSNVDMLKVFGIVAKARDQSNGRAFDLGASLSAPMVFQYVEWVMDQAIEKKINTLYFVLRDGYILKIVADEIIKYRGLKIRTEFLFGSRIAWRFPEIEINKLKNLNVWEKSNWIFRDPAFADVVFGRLGFDTKELEMLFGADFGKTIVTSFAQFKLLLEQALNNDDFSKMLQIKIAESRDLLFEYLDQTIDLTGEKFALVDTNSTGKTQNDLNWFLQKQAKKVEPLKFFYHTYLSQDTPNNKTQFVFCKANKADKRFPEALFRAPYNPCYGYKKINGKIEPKFFESEHCAWNESFDYSSYLEGIKVFTKLIEEYRLIDKMEISAYVQFLLRVVNFEIVSRDQIAQVAKLPFNPDLSGNEILDFYPKIEISALLHPFTRLIYFPKGSYYLAGGLWPTLYKIFFCIVNIKRKVFE